MSRIILAVDDSKMVLRIVSTAIESLGYRPVTANNGEMAMQLLESLWAEVDLILLDWNMPRMDGFETLTAIKRHPQWNAIPVMMVTTESERQAIVRAVQAGAKHYLTKPFNSQDLVTRILECLEVET